MRTCPNFLFLILLVACQSKNLNQGTSVPSGPDQDFNKIVGRWALVVLIRGGEVAPKGAVTQSGPVSYYIFNSDSTFMITMSDSIREKGRWSINPNLSPKTFDHTDRLVAAPYVVPGIYEVG